MQDVISILKKLDLTSLEAKIYLLLIEMGSSPASTIAKKGETKRTNIYNVLDKLGKMGLVSEVQKGHIRYFQATEPGKLIYIQEQNLKKLDKHIQELKEILHTLETMKSRLSIKPKVRFFQGKEGIGNLINQILNTEAFDAYFNPETAYDAYPDIMDMFLENGAKNQLNIRELIVQTAVTKKYIEKITNPNHQYKILPKKYNFYSDNFVFGNNVAFVSYLEGKIAILIESEDIAKSQKMAFELMWNAVK